MVSYSRQPDVLPKKSIIKTKGSIMHVNQTPITNNQHQENAVSSSLETSLSNLVDEGIELLEDSAQFTRFLIHICNDMHQSTLNSDCLSKIDNASNALTEYIQNFKERLQDVTIRIKPGSSALNIIPEDFYDRIENAHSSATTSAENMNLLFCSSGSTVATDSLTTIPEDHSV